MPAEASSTPAGTLTLPALESVLRFADRLSSDPTLPTLPALIARLHEETQPPLNKPLEAVLTYYAPVFAPSFFHNDEPAAFRALRLAYALYHRSHLLWGALRDNFSPLSRTNPLLSAQASEAHPDSTTPHAVKTVQRWLRLFAHPPSQRQELGLTDFVDCDPARSILSPAAYLVDLLRLVSAHPDGLAESLDLFNAAISAKSPAPDVNDDDGDYDDLEISKFLRARRPDIYSLPLTPENTYETIPYIQLINNALIAVIEQTHPASHAFDILANASFPITLPFNRSFEHLNLLLAELNVPLLDIIRAKYTKTLTAAFDFPRLQHDSPISSSSPASSISSPILFPSPTDLSSLSSLFQTSKTHKKAPTNVSSASLLEARLQLNLTERDCDIITTESRRPSEIASFYGFSSTDSDKLSTFLRSMATVSYFLGRTNLTREQLSTLLFQDLSPAEISAGQSLVFFINDVQDDLPFLNIRLHAKSRYFITAEEGEVIENLSWKKLDRIHRFLRLSRRLGWEFKDVDWALRAIDLHLSGQKTDESKALLFDGVDDLIVVPLREHAELNFFNRETLAVEMWVRPAREALRRADIEQPGILLASWSAGVSEALVRAFKAQWLIFLNADQQLCVWVGDEGADQNHLQFISYSSLSVLEFSHVCVQIDINNENEEVTVFINGVEQQGDDLRAFFNSSTNENNASPDTKTYPQIFRRSFEQTADSALHIGEFFHGNLKDVRIWDTTRSEQAVRDGMFNALTGYETNLIGYWPLSHTVVGKVLDLSKYNHSGVLGSIAASFIPKWQDARLLLRNRTTLSGLEFSSKDLLQSYLSVDLSKRQEEYELKPTKFFAISFWVSVHDTGNHASILEFEFEEPSSVDKMKLTIAMAGDKFKLFATKLSADNDNNSDQERSVSYNTTIVQDDLYFVCVKFDSLESRIWVRPELDGSTAGWSDRVEHFVVDPKIASMSVGVDFRGRIHDIRLWKDSMAKYDSFDALTHSQSAVLNQWQTLSATEGEGDCVQVLDEGFYFMNLLGRKRSTYSPRVSESESAYAQISVSREQFNPGIAMAMNSKSSIVIEDASQTKASLGQMNEGTVSFWFKCAGAAPFAKQLLFACGNDDVGVTSYVKDNETVVFLLWERILDEQSLSFVRTERNSISVKAKQLTPETWYQFAFSFKRKINNSNRFDVNVYLNNVEIGQLHDCTLPPTGDMILGGVPREKDVAAAGWIAFLDDEGLRTDMRTDVYFSGALYDFNLWAIWMSENDLKKVVQPAGFLAADGKRVLRIALHKLDQNVSSFTDEKRRTLHEPLHFVIRSDYDGKYDYFPKSFTARLDREKLIYIVEGEKETSSLYSFCETSLSGNDLIVSGRVRCSPSTLGLGVIVHRATEVSPHGISYHKGAVLRGRVIDGNVVFSLSNLPSSVDNNVPVVDESNLISFPVDRWVSFEITSRKLGDKYLLKAKVWLQGDVEPADFAMSHSIDAASSGLIGLWGFGKGVSMFDDIQARQNDKPVATIFQSFQEREAKPCNWIDVQTDRISFDISAAHTPDTCFGWNVRNQRGRKIVLFNKAQKNLLQSWNNRGATIEVRGEMMFQNDLGAIGVYFGAAEQTNVARADVALVRSPYDTARQVLQMTNVFHFRLEWRDHRGRPKWTEIPSATPVNGRWYHFKMQFQFGASSSMKAKIWEDGLSEPVEFLVEEKDISFGGGNFLGLMGEGPGQKQYDKIISTLKIDGEKDVTRTLNKTSLPDSLSPGSATDSFGIFSRIGEIAGRVEETTGIGFHTLYCPRTADETKRASQAVKLSNYTLCGRFFRATDKQAFGFTFQNLMPLEENLFCELALTPESDNLVLSSGFGDVLRKVANEAKGVTLGLGWHKFVIRTERNAEGKVSIKGKLWQEDELETEEDNFSFVESSPALLEHGTFGVWAMDRISHFHELQIMNKISVTSLLQNFSAWRHYKTEVVSTLFGFQVRRIDNSQKFVIEGEGDNDALSPTISSAESTKTTDVFYAFSQQRLGSELSMRCRLSISDLGGMVGVLFKHVDPRLDVLGLILGSNVDEEGDNGFFCISRFAPNDTRSVPSGANNFLPLGAANQRNGMRMNVNPLDEVYVRAETRLVLASNGDELLQLRANAWKVGEVEPSSFPVVGYIPAASIDGEFGFMSAGNGSKSISDLSLFYNRDVTRGSQNVSDSWVDVNRFDTTRSLAKQIFQRVELLDTSEEYFVKLHDAPVVDPLHLLEFKGSSTSENLLSSASFVSTNVPTRESWTLKLSVLIESAIVDEPSGPLVYVPRMNIYLSIQRASANSVKLHLKYLSKELSKTIERTNEVALQVAYFPNEGTEEVCLSVDGQIDDKDRLEVPKQTWSSDSATLFIGRLVEDEGRSAKYLNGKLFELYVTKGSSSPPMIDHNLHRNFYYIIEDAARKDELIASYPEESEKAFIYGGDLSLWSPSTFESPFPQAALSGDGDSVLKSALIPCKSTGQIRNGIQLEPHWTSSGESYELRRRTVEVAFRADDVLARSSSRLMQNVYKEGRFQIGISRGKLLFTAGDTTFSTDISDGEWNLATLVWSASGDIRSGAMACYLNGIVMSVEAGKAYEMNISEKPVVGGDGFEGLILNVSVFSDALGEDAIRQRRLIPISKRAVGTIKSEKQVDINASTISSLTSSDVEVPSTVLVSSHIGNSVSVPFSTVITSLGYLKEIVEISGQSVIRAVASWGPIKDYGRREQASYFDSLFNQGAANETDRWSVAMSPIAYDPGSGTTRDWNTTARLRSASRESVKNVEALLNESSIDGPILQRFMNSVNLKNLLSLDANLLMQLKEKFGLSHPVTPKDVADLVRLFGWLEAAEMNIEDILHFMGSFDYAMSANDVNQIVATVLEEETDIRLYEESFSGGELSPSEVKDFFINLKAPRKAGNIIDEEGLIQNDPFAGSTGISYGDNSLWSDFLYETFRPTLEVEFSDLNNLRPQVRDALQKIGSERALLNALHETGFIFGVNMFRGMSPKVLRNELSKSTSTELTIPESGDDLETVLDALIKNVLLRWERKARDVQERFVSFRDLANETLFRGFSSTFDVEPDTVEIVLKSGKSPSIYDVMASIYALRPDDANEDVVDEPDRVLAKQRKEEDFRRLSGQLSSCVKLSKLIDAFDLSRNEAEELLRSPSTFSVIEDLEMLDFQSVVALLEYTQIRSYVDDNVVSLTTEQITEKLLSIISSSTANSLEIMSELLDIRRDDIQWLLMKGSDSALSIHDVWYVYNVNRVAKLLFTDVRSLWRLSDDLPSEELEDFASVLVETLRAERRSESEKLLSTVSDKLLELSRDALLRYAISIITDEPAQYNLASNVLGDYLLLDVETGIRVLVSPVQQAIQSVQLYIHRTLLGLERKIELNSSVRTQWDTWLQSYRVWEAARRVYLYPENYVEPNLRSDTSAEFDVLADRISQGGDEDTVSSALYNYVEGVNKVLNNLRIAGSVVSKAGEANEQRLYLVGRTQTDPPETYVRQRVTTKKHKWSTWEKVEQIISADWISPVFAFGRLHLFWVEWTNEQVLYYAFGPDWWDALEVEENALDEKEGAEYDSAKSFIRSAKGKAKEVTLPEVEKEDGVVIQAETVYLIERDFMQSSIFDNPKKPAFESDQGKTLMNKGYVLTLPRLTPTVKYIVQDPSSSWSTPQSYEWGGIELFGDIKYDKDRTLPGEHRKPEYQILQCIPVKLNQQKQTDPKLIEYLNPTVLDAYNSTQRLKMVPTTESMNVIQVDALARIGLSENADVFTNAFKALLFFDNAEMEQQRANPQWLFYSTVPVCHFFSLSEGESIDIHLKWSEAIQRLDATLREWTGLIDLPAFEFDEDGNVTEESANARDTVLEENEKINQANESLLSSLRSFNFDEWGGFVNDKIQSQPASEIRARDLYDASYRLKLNKGYKQRLAMKFVFDSRTKKSVIEGPVLDSDSLDSWVHYSFTLDLESLEEVAVRSRPLSKNSRPELGTIETNFGKDEFPVGAVSYSVGGTLQGVADRIPFICQMALPRLWLMQSIQTSIPIFKNPESAEEHFEGFILDSAEGQDYSLAATLSFTEKSVGSVTLPTGKNITYVASEDLTLFEIEEVPTDFDTETIVIFLKDKISTLRYNTLLPFDVSVDPQAKLNTPVLSMFIHENEDFEQQQEVANICAEVRPKPPLMTRGQSGEVPDFFSGVRNLTIDTSAMKTRKFIFDSSFLSGGSGQRRFAVAENLLWETSTVQAVHNALGMFILDTDSASYLIEAHDAVSKQSNVLSDYFELKALRAESNRIILTLKRESDGEPEIAKYDFVIQRVSSSAPTLFLDLLSNGGANALYDRTAETDSRIVAQNATEPRVWFPAFTASKDPRKGQLTIPEQIRTDRYRTYTFFGLTLRRIVREDFNVRNIVSSIYGAASKQVYSSWKKTRSNTDSTGFNMLDFEGVNQVYFWELFMDVPTLIANGLNSSGEYQRAQQWIEYVFRPVRNNWKDESYNPWFFMPFRKVFGSGQNDVDGILAILNDEEDVEHFREDPFNAHQIASTRRFAYQKYIFQKYVSNLLDWGDSLFVDSRESLNKALIFYFTASKVLGRRPRSIRSDRDISDTSPIVIETLRQENDQSAEAKPLISPDFVVPYVEERSEENSSDPTGGTSSSAEDAMNPVRLMIYFCVPENDVVLGLWDRLEDRLYKIRNSLNIDGVFRQLSLFDPPLNPAALVRAVAGGASPLGAVSFLQRSVPHYRFDYMLAQANQAANFAVEMGSKLLEVLKSRDAESLTLLEANQAKLLNEYEVEIKTRVLNAAQYETQAAEIALNRVVTRKNRLTQFLNDGEKFEEQFKASEIAVIGAKINLSQTVIESASGLASFMSKDAQKRVEKSLDMSKKQAKEETDRDSQRRKIQISFERGSKEEKRFIRKIEENARRVAENRANTTKAKFKALRRQLITTTSEAALKAGAGTAETVPEFSSGTAGLGPYISVGIGGSKVARILTFASEVLSIGSAIADVVQQTAAAEAEKERFTVETTIERDALALEQRQMENGLRAAVEHEREAEGALNLAIAEGLSASLLLEAHKQKFTSFELYSWLSTEMTRRYRKAYNIAVGVARQAERGLQFELPTDQTFITGAGWSDAKRGLLATRTLQSELQRMTNYRLEQRARFLEVERRFSMKNEMKEAFRELIKNERCELIFTEEMFDMDFPGHYFRVLKYVAVTVRPTGNGRIEQNNSLRAMLKQTSNLVVMTNSIDVVNYLLDPKGKDAPTESELRYNWRANQAVALSKWEDDTGMFTVNYFLDDRYFSFEGTGAVSTWQLEIPKDSNEALKGDGSVALDNLNFEKFDDVDIEITFKYSAKADFGRFKELVQQKMETLRQEREDNSGV